MIRRRRRKREVEFSFDSFLDVVANVVGIILRLILVAWVAGKAYKGIAPTAKPLPALEEPTALPDPTDPREQTLEEAKRLVAEESKTAREALALLKGRSTAEIERELAEATKARLELLSRQRETRQDVEKRATEARVAALSLDELRTRAAKVAEEADRMRKLPPLRKTLRYHTPVSAEVQTEEVMFECKSGRVSLIDTQALVKKAMTQAEQRSGELRTSWDFTGLTPAVGPFRIKYTVSRQRSALDGPSGLPLGDGFRYGLTAWELVPEPGERGEAAGKALAEGSAFRRVADSLDPKQAVVTLWVYPDSFGLFRELRDHLHGKGFVVAGRPLTEKSPIGASPQGSASRGQ